MGMNHRSEPLEGSHLAEELVDSDQPSALNDRESPAGREPVERPSLDLYPHKSLQPSVLVVDDDRHLAELIQLELSEEGFEVRRVHSATHALETLRKEGADVVVLDLGLPDESGVELLAKIRQLNEALPVVVLTGRSDIESAVACMRAGAADFITKPFDRTRLAASVEIALRQSRLQLEVATLRRELRREGGFGSLIGVSSALSSTKELLHRAARSEVTVLLQGESGTGKEVAARAIHAESARASAPFVAINCGAIPAHLVESELFGHEKGSFTGADSTRRGCFEEADGGTLFLDEVGELPAEVQVRLLRVLQERTVQRVGSSKTIPVDVRIVAATNKVLLSEVKAGEFREDLFYRLSVFPVVLPALRERDQDVVLLAESFLARFSRESGRTLSGFSRVALEVLLKHSWPGNVRELMNVVQRAVLMEDGEFIHASSLPNELVQVLHPDGAPTELEVQVRVAGPLPEEQVELRGEVLQWSEYERRILLYALEQHAWRVKDVATALGVGRATLYRKIERYGLEAHRR